MLQYSPYLKKKARSLRKNMTDSEQVLWSRLRLKQIQGVQFYRQKPLGKYIVDFYAPRVKLVIEVDGSQHNEIVQSKKDMERDRYLNDLGLKVLRFNSREVLKETDAVIEAIYQVISRQMH